MSKFHILALVVEATTHLHPTYPDVLIYDVYVTDMGDEKEILKEVAKSRILDLGYSHGVDTKAQKKKDIKKLRKSLRLQLTFLAPNTLSYREFRL
jgi:hypothetical protein